MVTQPTTAGVTASIVQDHIARGEGSTPTVAIGQTSDLDLQLSSLLTQLIVPLKHVAIVQVDVVAGQLAVSDGVNVRIFSRSARHSPMEVVADFDGTSQLTDVWAASFSNRRIDYEDLDKKEIMWVRITNKAGNSKASDFRVTVHVKV